MNKVTIKIKVKAKDPSKLPDWGLGPGILAEQEVTLDEELTENNKIRFHLKMDEIYQDLLESTLEKIIESVIEEK
jgi:hypothetical protein